MAVSMGPELGVLVAAVGLGLALSGAAGDVVGESKSADESVGDMLACWHVGLWVGMLDPVLKWLMCWVMAAEVDHMDGRLVLVGVESWR